MKSNFIKKITEKQINLSENRIQNRVEITFETLREGEPVCENITLSGEGSLKVLMPV